MPSTGFVYTIYKLHKKNLNCKKLIKKHDSHIRNMYTIFILRAATNVRHVISLYEVKFR